MNGGSSPVFRSLLRRQPPFEAQQRVLQLQRQFFALASLLLDQKHDLMKLVFDLRQVPA